MIGIIPYSPKKIECRVDEAMRYMGYKSENSSVNRNDLTNMVYGCKAELENVLNPKACYAEFEIDVFDNCVLCEFGRFYSTSLAKNLKGCKRAFAFCATIGVQTDILIKKHSIAAPSKSVICDALASSAVEVWCDEVENIISGSRGTRPRFSAGYGDFDIKYQKEISNFLNTPKNCGVTVTDSMMMIPTKSVTAIVGIDDKLKYKSKKSKCALCLNKHCEYRND